MKLKHKIKIFWKNRDKIISGIWNTWFPNSYVENIAKERAKICESDICNMYDKDGSGEECYVQGSACCMSCGCKLSWKQRSLSSSCGLEGTGREPLWKAVMSEDEELKFRAKTGIKNE